LSIFFSFSVFPLSRYRKLSLRKKECKEERGVKEE
jgi:hypothetical protein